MRLDLTWTWSWIKLDLDLQTLFIVCILYIILYKHHFDVCDRLTTDTHARTVHTVHRRDER